LTRDHARTPPRELVATSLFFCLSGIAALIYQVTWQRLLVLHTGVGLYSVSLIVAAFLAGLGLGSHFGGVLSTRLAPRVALGVFGLIEIGIASFAALSCWLYYDLLYLRAVFLYQAPWRAGLLHFSSLLVPTGLMGMSLPFLAQAMVREARTAGSTLGVLYGLNVIGAGIGALIAPWLLIRHLGLCGAILGGVACNLAAGLGALALLAWGRSSRTPAEAAPVSPGEIPTGAGAPAPRTAFGFWLALYAVSGFCALALEMVWFRVMDVAVRATAFSFGSMLAVYLLGLGAGSLLGARLVVRLKQPLGAFLVCQCLLLLYAGAGLFLLAELPTDFPLYRWLFDHWRLDRVFALGQSAETGSLLRLYGALPLALYGPPTILMGFSFVILQRAVQDDPGTSGRKVGFLQAGNIAGNVAGSLLVGLVLLTVLGTTGTVRALLAIGVFFAALGMRRYRVRSIFGLLAAALALLLFAFPGQRDFWLRFHGLDDGPALIEEDATSVVALKAEGYSWRVMVNGQRHSWIPFGGIHSWLGALPALMHPGPREAAVVGLGSGDTAWAAGVRPETRRIEVFEIAAPQKRLLESLSTRYEDLFLRRFLDDPRVTVTPADGRRAVLHGERLFDVIVVDALRPTMSGSGYLYSVEFFESCARQLKPGGLMSTWVPTPRVHASFRKAFPHVLGVRGGEMLVGSIHPLEVDLDRWTARLEAPEVLAYLGPDVSAELRDCLLTVRPALRGLPRESGFNRDLFPRDEFMVP
jgi:spermidine synthase